MAEQGASSNPDPGWTETIKAGKVDTTQPLEKDWGWPDPRRWEPNSLFIFSLRNPVRKMAIFLCERGRLDAVVLLAILASTTAMALNDPYDTPEVRSCMLHMCPAEGDARDSTFRVLVRACGSAGQSRRSATSWSRALSSSAASLLARWGSK